MGMGRGRGRGRGRAQRPRLYDDTHLQHIQDAQQRRVSELKVCDLLQVSYMGNSII